MWIRTYESVQDIRQVDNTLNVSSCQLSVFSRYIELLEFSNLIYENITFVFMLLDKHVFLMFHLIFRQGTIR